MTRAEALANAYRQLTEAGIPTTETRTEATLLLRHATGLSREELFLRPDVPLTDDESERFDASIRRRANREPLAYITGTRDFYGLTFAVTPDVLIPRPETEGVVDAVLSLTAVTLTPGTQRVPGVRTYEILDLCTGSGCITIAIAVHLTYACITATDISAGALAVARSNAERYGVSNRVSFLMGDLFAPILPGSQFDVIASNPPYIAPEEIEQLEPEVRDFEPRIALGIDADDLHFYRRIARESPAYLTVQGGVVVEVGQGQADPVCELFHAAGFADVSTVPDLAGIPRVVIAKSYREP